MTKFARILCGKCICEKTGAPVFRWQRIMSYYANFFFRVHDSWQEIWHVFKCCQWFPRQTLSLSRSLQDPSVTHATIEPVIFFRFYSLGHSIFPLPPPPNRDDMLLPRGHRIFCWTESTKFGRFRLLFQRHCQEINLSIFFLQTQTMVSLAR